MKVLVIGGGGREHSRAWKLKQCERVHIVFVAPGNGGTAADPGLRNVPITDPARLADFAAAEKVALTVVGPEAPLAAGIVDMFQKRKLRVFGPSKAAAQIEASKVFSKNIMQKYGIPCAQGEVFSSYPEARDYVKSRKAPMVIKADGLAAGKGVTVAASKDQALEALSDAMEKRTLGDAGNTVIVEECLVGKEVSLLAFTDGKSVSPMVPACDYKRVFDNDKGPNTGGMGGYSPPGFFSQEMVDEALHTVLEPTVRAMATEKMPYRGVLYAGLMITAAGIKVLEFNARFGDPETQVMLPRLKTDLVDIMLAVIDGKLGKMNIEWSQDPCVGVVMASGGYPGKYQTGFPITGLDKLDKDIMVFHAGTALKGSVVTSGGRVLTVAANGKSIAEARSKIYANISRIQFEGCHYRKDIAAREVK